MIRTKKIHLMRTGIKDYTHWCGTAIGGSVTWAPKNATCHRCLKAFYGEVRT